MSKSMKVPVLILEHIEEAEKILYGLELIKAKQTDLPDAVERHKNLMTEIKKIIVMMGKNIKHFT